MVELSEIAIGIGLLITIVFLRGAITTVKQYEKAIVERFGQYKETMDPGLRFIMPVVDRVADRIDMRETVIDVAPQAVITKDNVAVVVDAVIYYVATDPKAVRYEVANFRLAITKLAQTNLRNLIGDMTLDETLTARDVINEALRETLDTATDKWGVKVVRVEVQKIDPPQDIADAMSKQMKAEREKRATILEAEAYREKQILEAEGDKQNAILKAEGDREAEILRADGEAKAIEKVSKAAEEFFVGNAQILKQLEVTQASLQENTKIVVSDQSKLINILDMLKEGDKKRIVPLGD
ncbi:MAG: SPFH domain-containing protein [Halobacteriota archaeon]|nr:SPFH domain-containing protein [Halobacteriota archaeon]